MQYQAQVVRIFAHDFGKNTVEASGIIGFHHFGNLFELFGNFIVQRTFIEVNTQKSRYIEAEFVVVDDQTGALDDAELFHFLHPDVDGAAGNKELFGNIGVRNFTVLDEFCQDLLVQLIYIRIFCHGRSVS